MNYQDILEANKSIGTINIKGKDYAEVNQRIKAFRMLYPEGFIKTNITLSADGTSCICEALAGYYDGDRTYVLGTGTAHEDKADGMINKTSFVENCETSAVGRALGMLGLGIDTSVCSAEELQTALNKQKSTEAPKATEKQIAILKQTYTGENLAKLLQANNISKLEDMPLATASNIISKLKGESK